MVELDESLVHTAETSTAKLSLIAVQSRFVPTLVFVNCFLEISLGPTMNILHWSWNCKAYPKILQVCLERLFW